MLNSLYVSILSKSNKGIIYTCYPSTEETKSEGNTIDIKEIPTYVGDVLLQTTILIRVKTVPNPISGGKKFYAIIDSKYKDIKSGSQFDITDELLSKFIKL